MSRPLRIEYPEAVYHVTSRGDGRGKIFTDDSDKEKFLEVLDSVIKRYNWLCHAYCLMNNHYHLLIETPDANLSMGMRQLNGIYTQAYNRRHRKPGHLFQGRYKAILVQKENHLLELCRYVVLNPVRAKIIEKPENWKWSSYAATCGLKKDSKFLKVDWILGQFGSERKAAQKRYKEFVMEGIQKGSPWEDIQGQILLGEDGFTEKFKELLADKEKIKEIPRHQRYLGRPSLAEIFKEVEGRNKEIRNTNIRIAHLKFGYTLKEIADCLRIHYTTISKVLKERENKN
ncbi:MAG: transposase [Nitrospinae bacterium]|nr:transposase [Nitrospinota bacterium]